MTAFELLSPERERIVAEKRSTRSRKNGEGGRGGEFDIESRIFLFLPSNAVNAVPRPNSKEVRGREWKNSSPSLNFHAIRRGFGRGRYNRWPDSRKQGQGVVTQPSSLIIFFTRIATCFPAGESSPPVSNWAHEWRIRSLMATCVRGLVLSGRVSAVFLFRAGARFERRRLNERFQRGRLEAEPIAGSQSERNWSHGLRFAINGIESTPASPASLRSSFGTTHDAETASVARRNGGRERRASGRRRKEGREDGEEARGWGGGWEASILGNGRAAK